MDDQPMTIIEDQLTKEFSKQQLENQYEDTKAKEEQEQQIVADEQF